MTKTEFIQSLKNGQVPFQENQKQFEQFIQVNAFDAFDAHLASIDNEKHRWSSQYFEEKITELESMNFSQELASHVIEVKKSLQERGIDANFRIKKSEELTTTTVETEKRQSVNQPQAVPSQPKFAKIDLAGFQPNERLLDLLKKGEVNHIRTGLMSLLDNRRLSLEEVAKSVWYVWQNKPEIFVDEEESVFVQGMDKNELNWNLDYFNLQKVYLNRNFSLERLLHLVNVRETLMKRGDKNFQQIKVEKPTSSTISNNVPEHRTEDKTQADTNITRESYQAQISTEPKTTHSSENNNEKGIQKLLLIGGAVLALFATLFAIFK
ncbi:hypothetical protein [Frederiksenia canicola]